MDDLQELNVQVAEALGHQRVSQNEPYIWPTKEQVEELRTKYPDLVAVDYYIVPPYSTSIAAAWELVEQLKRDTPHSAWTIETVNLKGGSVLWYASFWYDHDDGTITDFMEHAPTAPEAICRAFLAAKGE